MASTVTQSLLGIDVAKDWLDISNGNTVVRIDNTPQAIKGYLKQYSLAVSIAIEPTSSYHEVFVHYALLHQHTVYLVDAYRVSRYRDAVGIRAKTDSNDAHLLYRYLEAEQRQLKAYQEPPKAIKRLMNLLRARSKLIQSKGVLEQSLANIAELKQTKTALLKRMDSAIDMIDRKLQQGIEKAGYTTDYQRCISIPSIGPLNAVALVAMYHRGEFRKSDAFVAYLGLDVRVKDSGKYKGQRKLTKRGNAEVRRLLFNAARSGSRTAKWKPYYQSLKERGLSPTAATVALSRKLARLAFALLRDQSTYQEPAIMN